MGTTQAGRITPKSITSGDLADSAGIKRTQMETKSLDKFPFSTLMFRKFDSVDLNLPAAGTGSHLGLVTGTYGSAGPELQTGDLKSAGATTRKARMLVMMPNIFIAAGSASFRLRAGMKTTIADTSATIDLSAYQILDDGTLSADLITTAAQSINNLTSADKDFTLDASALSPGDRLDVQVSIAVTDAATLTAVIGLMRNFMLRCDCQP